MAMGTRREGGNALLLVMVVSVVLSGAAAIFLSRVQDEARALNSGTDLRQARALAWEGYHVARRAILEADYVPPDPDTFPEGHNEAVAAALADSGNTLLGYTREFTIPGGGSRVGTVEVTLVEVMVDATQPLTGFYRMTSTAAVGSETAAVESVLRETQPINNYLYFGAKGDNTWLDTDPRLVLQMNEMHSTFHNAHEVTIGGRVRNYGNIEVLLPMQTVFERLVSTKGTITPDPATTSGQTYLAGYEVWVSGPRHFYDDGQGTGPLDYVMPGTPSADALARFQDDAKATSDEGLYCRPYGDDDSEWEDWFLAGTNLRGWPESSTDLDSDPAANANCRSANPKSHWDTHELDDVVAHGHVFYVQIYDNGTVDPNTSDSGFPNDDTMILGLTKADVQPAVAPGSRPIFSDSDLDTWRVRLLDGPSVGWDVEAQQATSITRPRFVIQARPRFEFIKLATSETDVSFVADFSATSTEIVRDLDTQHFTQLYRNAIPQIAFERVNTAGTATAVTGSLTFTPDDELGSNATASYTGDLTFFFEGPVNRVGGPVNPARYGDWHPGAYIYHRVTLASEQDIIMVGGSTYVDAQGDEAMRPRYRADSTLLTRLAPTVGLGSVRASGGPYEGQAVLGLYSHSGDIIFARDHAHECFHTHGVYSAVCFAPRGSVGYRGSSSAYDAQFAHAVLDRTNSRLSGVMDSDDDGDETTVDLAEIAETGWHFRDSRYEWGTSRPLICLYGAYAAGKGIRFAEILHGHHLVGLMDGYVSGQVNVDLYPPVRYDPQLERVGPPSFPSIQKPVFYEAHLVRVQP
ncbi:MAG: hypothetical protein HY722_10455 [Planctomycetes bacterium]|nr:hypothetical protein [Planctomycetota bacterium]